MIKTKPDNSIDETDTSIGEVDDEKIRQIEAGLDPEKEALRAEGLGKTNKVFASDTDVEY